MKSDSILEFPNNSAWGIFASGKQGYKKVILPLITFPQGTLWSVFLVLKFLLGCTEMSGYMETLLYSTSEKRTEKQQECHNSPLILNCLSFLPRVLTSILFPSQHPLFYLKWASWLSLVYYASSTLIQCAYDPDMTNQCISSPWWALGQLLTHTGLTRTKPGRVSSLCYWGYWENLSLELLAAILLFCKNQVRWEEPELHGRVLLTWRPWVQLHFFEDVPLNILVARSQEIIFAKLVWNCFLSIVTHSLDFIFYSPISHPHNSPCYHQLFLLRSDTWVTGQIAGEGMVSTELTTPVRSVSDTSL